MTEPRADIPARLIQAEGDKSQWCDLSPFMEWACCMFPPLLIHLLSLGQVAFYDSHLQSSVNAPKPDVLYNQDHVPEVHLPFGFV